MDPEYVAIAHKLLDYEFSDMPLLKRAVTHASLVDSRLESNERLEFLGDSVLGVIVCDYLYRKYPDLLEGELTKIKSLVVSRRVCAEVAKELGLDELLRLGKGMSNRASLPRSVLAAVYEALIGAIYLDGGLKEARKFILTSMKPRIEASAKSGHQSNFKSVLQQLSQQQFDHTPQYLVLDEQGPDHAKCFEICVEIGARRFASCWGPSKKQAEQQAALEALVELGHAVLDDEGEVHIAANGEIPQIEPGK